jgi:hypothetical protein
VDEVAIGVPDIDQMEEDKAESDQVQTTTGI